jgi:uncharacterized protein (DUF58 family)
MVSRQPEGFASDMEHVWSFLNSPGVPRSLVILLTDFQAPLKASNSFSAACRKHETVAILASDPREWELPKVGRIRVQDPETGRTRLVNTGSAEVRDEYRRNGQCKRDQVSRLLHAGGVDWVEFSTSAEYESTLRRFLEMRSLRRGCRHR